MSGAVASIVSSMEPHLAVLLRVQLLEAGRRLQPQHIDETVLLEHAHLVYTG